MGEDGFIPQHGTFPFLPHLGRGEAMVTILIPLQAGLEAILAVIVVGVFLLWADLLRRN
jgi:hypothetical protein